MSQVQPPVSQPHPGRDPFATAKQVRKSAKLWSPEDLRTIDVRTDWAMAGLLFVISWIGSTSIAMVRLDDWFDRSRALWVDWTYLGHNWKLVALQLLIAALYQVVVQAKQFANCRTKRTWRYAFWFGASWIPNLIGYLPLLVPIVLARMVDSQDGAVLRYSVGALVAVGIAAALWKVDTTQEDLLIRR